VSEPWVVTYSIEYCGQIMIAEFYRGDHAECIRIFEHSAGGEDDRYRTKGWRANTGPAEAWDKVIEDL
jgi:hypothetical protein